MAETLQSMITGFNFNLKLIKFIALLQIKLPNNISIIILGHILANYKSKRYFCYYGPNTKLKKNFQLTVIRYGRVSRKTLLKHTLNSWKTTEPLFRGSIGMKSRLKNGRHINNTYIVVSCQILVSQI